MKNHPHGGPLYEKGQRRVAVVLVMDDDQLADLQRVRPDALAEVLTDAVASVVQGDVSAYVCDLRPDHYSPYVSPFTTGYVWR